MLQYKDSKLSDRKKLSIKTTMHYVFSAQMSMMIFLIAISSLDKSQKSLAQLQG